LAKFYIVQNTETSCRFQFSPVLGWATTILFSSFQIADDVYVGRSELQSASTEIGPRRPVAGWYCQQQLPHDGDRRGETKLVWGRSETACRGGRANGAAPAADQGGAKTDSDGVEQLLSQVQLLKYQPPLPDLSPTGLSFANDRSVNIRLYGSIEVATSLRALSDVADTTTTCDDDDDSCGRWLLLHVSLCLLDVPTSWLVILSLQHFELLA